MSIRSAGEDELGDEQSPFAPASVQLFPNYLRVAVLDGTKPDPGQCWWQRQI